MASFDTFLKSFDEKPHIKGDQFEDFVKHFLASDSSWSTQVGEIWKFREWPGCWGKDKGIDIIYKDKVTGEIWAVQAKRYDPKLSITKDHVNKFLSESNRPAIDKRLLIASTDKIHADGLEVIEAQDKPVRKYLYSDFNEAEYEYPNSISEVKLGHAKSQPVPFPYQEQAIKNVIKGFENSQRGQLIMPCGTGKTYTSLWIKESLEAEITLVLVPTLNLLSQTLRKWTFAATLPFNALCVCSDKTIRDKNYDEVEDEVSFPTTTNSTEVRDFLLHKGSKVIFSTYDSSPVIKNAQKDSELVIDLVIADEAHRCAGELGRVFSTILDKSLIKAKRRLFTTATQRYYSTNLKRKASERGIDVIGMDDKSKFGPVFHNLSFAEAINHNPPLLTDYQVAIIAVNSPMIANSIRNRELVRTKSDKTLNAKSLAAQVGLIKAMKDYDMKRVITFHHTIKGAKDFALNTQDILEIINPESKPNGSIWSDSVSSELNSHKRRMKLKHLKELESSNFGFLSNARCLSEGIDIPSLDGIAFIDPKNSSIDIVQAVGRAIRLSENKTKGTIVLPVFIEDGDNEEDSIQKSNFKKVWSVINALRAHDETLAFELDNFRTKLGEQGGGKTSSSFSKIIFDLPETVDISFAEAIKTLIVERTSSSWNYYFGLLKKYTKENKTARVLRSHIEIGGWVNSQRTYYKTGQLSDYRIKLLESLPGWTWNPAEDNWNTGFDYLLKYVEENKDARIEIAHQTEDGFMLGRWVQGNRKSYKKGKLNKERIKLLESLPGWVWDTKIYDWNIGFDYLVEYVAENKDAKVNLLHETDDGFNLGRWVSTQRRNYKKGKLNNERIKRLESLPGWSWDPFEDDWNTAFNHLLKYVEKFKTSRVDDDYKTDDGFKLSEWCKNRRRDYGYGRLSKKQIKFLESLPGWSWDLNETDWNIAFDYLVKYVAKNKNALVKGAHKTDDDFNLGRWVLRQRQKYTKGTLQDDRIKRLESLPGWSWNPVEDEWTLGFDYLVKYVAKNKNARVSVDHQTDDDFNLGRWVFTQREKYKKGKLNDDRIKRLESVSGWSWNPTQDDWNNAFDHLIKYVEEFKTCHVKESYQTDDGINLGYWVQNQRRKYKQGKLKDEKIRLLESVPGWLWKVKK